MRRPQTAIDGNDMGRHNALVSSTVPARPIVKVRGRSFIALALTPETPIADWLTGLDQQIARAPGFFAGKPVVLDLSLTQLHGPGLRAFVSELRERGIRVLGVEGIEAELLGEHLDDLPPILTGGRPGGVVDTPDAAANRVSREFEPNSLLVRKPVRSGQSIQFLRGDVTVIGSVASGAEIVAGGSIHVYGTLRGRAFAGISGDTGARIFCNRLEAELLAINGSYATSDGLGPELRGRGVQAWFDGHNIALAAIG